MNIHQAPDESLAKRRVEAYRMGRKRRGDIRVFLLWSLTERPMHGYELIKYLQEKTYGLWTPSPGSVYPTLQLLEDQGMISGEEHDGKRVFSITDTGRREAERMQTGSFADDPMQADAIRQLREANMMVRQMMKRLIRGASTSELKAAADIMLHTQSQLARLFND